MNDKKIKSHAVIAAAGSGQRMGGISKPNITLLGKTLFEYVLSAFDNSSVDGITVVCSEDNKESLEKLSKGCKKPVCFTLGGKTRSESVFKGVTCAPEDAEIICVHDCARPFITAEIIDSAILAANSTGASCVCSPITDTVKYKTESGEITTPDRSRLFAVQTPQCFKKSIYTEARNKCDHLDLFTDETSLLEQGGFKVEYITICENNMKLTSKSDVPLAEAIMKGRNSGL